MRARPIPARPVRFENDTFEAFRAADCEQGACFELFVQNRCSDAAGVARKRPFDLDVLRIKGDGFRDGSSAQTPERR